MCTFARGMKARHIIVLFAALEALSCSKLSMEPQMSVRVSEQDVIDGKDISGSGLPVLFVKTSDGKGVKEKTRSKDAGLSMYDGSGLELVRDLSMSIKGRGHGSWGFPKKPYNLSLAEPLPLLGGSRERDWCLLANWRDMTLLRNDVALEISRCTSLEWTPAGRFVDLVVDGRYQGNYYLCEKVQVAPGRVDVEDDGWLICLDNYYDATYRFKSKIRQLPVNIKLADGCALDLESFNKIRACIDAAEDALYRGAGDWTAMIDMQSFCDWLIVHELTGNNEPTRPHSVYMHKRSDGLITAGPCWDFDCRTFMPGRKGLLNRNTVWFDALLAKEEFCSLLKERWHSLKPVFEQYIVGYIDDVWASIEASAEMDRRMWPISTVYSSSNGDENLSPAEAFERLRSAYAERLISLDEAICAL